MEHERITKHDILGNKEGGFSCENDLINIFKSVLTNHNFHFFFTKIVSQMIFISILVSILEVTLEDACMKCVKHSYNQHSVTFDKLYK